MAGLQDFAAPISRAVRASTGRWYGCLVRLSKDLSRNTRASFSTTSPPPQPSKTVFLDSRLLLAGRQVPIAKSRRSRLTTHNYIIQTRIRTK
ncbi:hypothetical protein E2C01_033609 [Portunus trituberculatus]|uniref:Uncharacterized protein n=1 Tax=Portunus trituberculatus TaxID=210409 RepID=A0A5B7F3D5_PORTR|nr:hypothetical protein [Portunus trituberculatus]